MRRWLEPLVFSRLLGYSILIRDSSPTDQDERL